MRNLILVVVALCALFCASATGVATENNWDSGVAAPLGAFGAESFSWSFDPSGVNSTELAANIAATLHQS